MTDAETLALRAEIEALQRTISHLEAELARGEAERETLRRHIHELDKHDEALKNEMNRSVQLTNQNQAAATTLTTSALATINQVLSTVKDVRDEIKDVRLEVKESIAQSEARDSKFTEELMAFREQLSAVVFNYSPQSFEQAIDAPRLHREQAKQQVIDLLENNFGKNDLNILAFDCGLGELDEFDSYEKRRMVREMVEKAIKRAKYTNLVLAAKRERPFLDWPLPKTGVGDE